MEKKDLNWFDIEKGYNFLGKNIAVIGKSGSGKSTIIAHLIHHNNGYMKEWFVDREVPFSKKFLDKNVIYMSLGSEQMRKIDSYIQNVYKSSEKEASKIGIVSDTDNTSFMRLLLNHSTQYQNVVIYSNTYISVFGEKRIRHSDLVFVLPKQYSGELQHIYNHNVILNSELKTQVDTFEKFEKLYLENAKDFNALVIDHDNNKFWKYNAKNYYINEIKWDKQRLFWISVLKDTNNPKNFIRFLPNELIYYIFECSKISFFDFFIENRLLCH